MRLLQSFLHLGLPQLLLQVGPQYWNGLSAINLSNRRASWLFIDTIRGRCVKSGTRWIEPAREADHTGHENVSRERVVSPWPRGQASLLELVAFGLKTRAKKLDQMGRLIRWGYSPALDGSC